MDIAFWLSAFHSHSLFLSPFMFDQCFSAAFKHYLVNSKVRTFGTMQDEALQCAFIGHNYMLAAQLAYSSVCQSVGMFDQNEICNNHCMYYHDILFVYGPHKANPANFSEPLIMHLFCDFMVPKGQILILMILTFLEPLFVGLNKMS